MIMIDVRTPEEHRAGHVPSSVNLPLDQIAAGETPAVDLQEKIVVYCRSGARSEQAKQLLERQGFTNVTNGGGIGDIAV